jgi:plasmid replication initiation protein
MIFKRGSWLKRLSDKLGEPVEMAALRFLENGGTTRPEDWISLTPYEIAALIAAGNQIRDPVPDPEIAAYDRVARLIDKASGGI